MLTINAIFRTYSGVVLLAVGAGPTTLGAAFCTPFLGQWLFLAGLLVVTAIPGWLAARDPPAIEGQSPFRPVPEA